MSDPRRVPPARLSIRFLGRGTVPLRTGAAPEAVPVSVSLAWRHYLSSVRACSPERYEESEELAWRRLEAELARVGRALPDPH